MRQILYNLIYNAVKFTPNGGTITLKTGLSQGEVFFEVADTGYGMTEAATKSSCFNPIIEPMSPLTIKYPVQGWGLFIVSKLVKALHGQIEAVSEPDVGSTFTVRFPLDARSKA